jgi:hypothetical protein
MQIDQLKLEAQLAYDRELARKNIKQQMQARLIVTHSQGVFVVDRETINFLSLFDNQSIILLDAYDNPIKVNALELYKLMISRYHEVMNEWSIEWEDKNKIRSARHV